MPLDDREQEILEEIERRFYEQDPELAYRVRTHSRLPVIGLRLPFVGLLTGIVIVILTFTDSAYAAIAGFILMVVSATFLATALGFGGRSGEGEEDVSGVQRRSI